MSVGDNDLRARLLKLEEQWRRSHRGHDDADLLVAADVLDDLGIPARLQAAEKVVEAAERMIHAQDNLIPGEPERGEAWAVFREALAAWKEQG